MPVTTTQGYRGKLVDKLTSTILDQFADEDILISNNILQLFDLSGPNSMSTHRVLFFHNRWL